MSCLPSKRIYQTRIRYEKHSNEVMLTWIYLPKRDELSFLVVFALPKASRMGLVARIWRSISLESSKENFVLVLLDWESGGLTEARYLMMNLAYSSISV